MYPTTTEYDNAIYDNVIEIKGKIEFELIDIDAYVDAGAITVTGENAISRKDETNDLVRDMSGKYMTYETNHTILDGSFVLPPKVAETQYQVGWWSLAQSQSDSTFSAPQIYTKPFLSSQNSIGLTIIFDPQSDEYAEEFDIEVFDGVTSIANISVTGNTLVKYIWETNLSNYDKVVITITKWAEPFRYARITELDYGIIKEYLDDDMASLTVLKEIELIGDELASDEISFVLDNSNQEFNILNPTGIYPFLQKRQRIKPYYGLVLADDSVEWIPMGIYYLTEWNSDQGSLTASFVARDLLDLFEQQRYRKGKVQARTITNLLTDIFTDFGLSSVDYNIDSALDSITVNGNIPIRSFRGAIQFVANAGQAVTYIDRLGVVQVQQLSDTVAVDNIDFDNVANIPKIALDKRINTIEVAVNTYTSKASSENLYTGSVSFTGTKDIWVEYKEFPATSVSSVVGGLGTLNSETSYGNASLLNITSTGIATITTTGTVQERAESIFTKVFDDIGDSEETVSIKLNNPLIASDSIASDVADWIETVKSERFINEVNWNMNPAHEVGIDRVIVEDDFAVNKTSRIIKNEFRYNGGLNGRTVTQGGE